MTAQPRRDPSAPLSVDTAPVNAHVSVSPHHLASRAAVDIMSRGGNAVDAAVCANAVLGVVLPDTCGPGGDLFALVHRPGHEIPLALNSSGRAGSGSDADVLRAAGHTEMPARSPWTITVPGCVDGWEALLDRAGTMTMADVLGPAIGLARDGFPVAAEFAMSLERLRNMLADQASAPPLYPGGEPPERGTILSRPRLAETLESIAEEGRDAFYSGEVGTRITAVTSGAVTADDLEVCQAEWVEAIGLQALGAKAWTIPPNSQGYVTPAAAWLFERFTDAREPTDPDFQHALIEAYRSIAAERYEMVSDPRTAPLSPGELLDPDRLGPRLATFDPFSAASWPGTRLLPGGTAFLCTRDGSGCAVALIQSNYHGIGTGLSAGDTGVFLHDRGGGFNLIPGHPNELKPGNRPFHTLAPTLWTRGDRLAAVLGTRGGEYQPQYLLQMAANLFRAGMSPVQAQAAPRWQVAAGNAEDETIVWVEPSHGRPMIDALRARGHDARVAAPWQPGWGPVSVIAVGEGVSAAADPRTSTSAAASS